MRAAAASPQLANRRIGMSSMTERRDQGAPRAPRPCARPGRCRRINRTAAAGLDLVAAVERREAHGARRPAERALVPTGLIMELPAGYEGQVRPRSGLAFKHGVTVLNSPGTIDSDYRGEVKIFWSISASEPFEIVRVSASRSWWWRPVSQATLVSARALIGDRARGRRIRVDTDEDGAAKKKIPSRKASAAKRPSSGRRA